MSISSGEQDLIPSPSSTLYTTSPTFPGLNAFTLPRLEIPTLDTSPFSTSFSGLIEDDLEVLNWQRDTELVTDHDISYNIEVSISLLQYFQSTSSPCPECFTNVSELAPEWDDDVDEILVMCPKNDRQLPTIEEEPPRVDIPQSITLADFDPLPDVLVTASGAPFKQASEKNVLELLMEVKASFLPRIHCSFWKDDLFFIAIVLNSVRQEYYSRETIGDIVNSEGPMNPERARFFACEIIQGLTALHAAGIIHRDLQPENIFIDNAGHVIIEGFGSSEVLPYSHKGRSDIFCAVPVRTASAFCAPELILGWTHDHAVDIWGFGVLLLYMISGRTIFGNRDTSFNERKNMIVSGPISLPLPLEPSTHDLILKCLERNPAARLRLYYLKKHSYFSSIDWKKVAAKRIRAPCSVQLMTGKNRNLLPSRLHQGLPASSQTRMMSRIGSKGSLKEAHFPAGVPQGPSSTCRIDDPATSLPEPEVYSSLTLTYASPNPADIDLNIQDRMALFWETLDSEQQVPSSLELSPCNVAPHRPRKLRKSRSSIYPEHRFSSLCTSSLQNLNKLCKLGRSTPALPRHNPVADFPEGVKQIGGGIGFKYKAPTAALSKASICTDVPQACHGLFPGLQGLGIRFLRSPTAIAKAKTRRTLSKLVVQQKHDDHQSFPIDYRGSSWSFVMPVSPKSCASVGAPRNSLNQEYPPFPPNHNVCVAVEEDEERFQADRPDDAHNLTLRLVDTVKAKAET
ncbi:hypothetical protein H0H92_006570 [Tricholoma furcatifolium]|nr:hypothetical protein H0H92_006570 [Tricholoma furcatifolium]